MFSFKPDYFESKKRFDAFWEREIIDRPPVTIHFGKENRVPIPHKEYKSHKDRWLDIEFRAETTALHLSNTEFYADALPIAWPNLGPEVFSAWCGCGYEFGQDTTWSKPCIEDWERDADKVALNKDHPLFELTVEYTKLLLELGKGKFIVGLTDFHPGGDHLAALRDPQNLNIDMIENPDEVKAMLDKSYKDFFEAYEVFYNMVHSAGMPTTSWTSIIHDGRFYIPSCDFSCMISKNMFDEFFLPGIIKECQYYEKSIYHLDGPGALRHLDSILEIKELDAVQWVYGAGNEGYHKWVDVYQRIQKAGKGIELSCHVNELGSVFETLRPEGIWFSSIRGIDSRDTAEKVLKCITKWSL